MANRKNPIPLIIPCHRVIGTNGNLTGFAHGLAIKEKIINHEKLMTLFDLLLSYYGKQDWWPAETHYEMMVGAVLTQNTTWKNVVKALNNFNGDLSPRLIKEISMTALADIIRPSGYFNQKAIKLKALNDWYERYDFDIEKVRSIDGDVMREELLAVHGIGRETADSIMTYAVGKPYFIVDTYTRRLFHRMGFDIPVRYDDFRKMIEEALPRDLYLYNELHALIVQHATEHCLKKPKCDSCPLATSDGIQGNNSSEFFCTNRMMI
jgi:endonuclease-3 related protein